MIEVSLLIKNIKELVNPAAHSVVRGNHLNSIKVSHDVWIGASAEHISFIGHEQDFGNNCTLADDAIVIDASHFVALPGLVDPHTHLPFAGSRQDEFRQKLQGVSYLDIARKGGGIKGTVRQTREIGSDELIAVCENRLDQFLAAGTTTVEAKSGYGLDFESEIKQLEVLAALRHFHPVDIVPTFLGAHDIPEEYQGRNRQYLDYLIQTALPEVKRRKLAEFVDIFCEDGYFSPEDTQYYLDAATELGFKLKVHADEFTSNGAAKIAADNNAVSAEHLIAMTADEISAIAASNTTCVFLPGVSFFLKLEKYAPAREVISKNGIVALGSDFNPGSSMISSQLFIFHLAIFQMGLTIEEALNMITINAAYAVNRQDQVGSIAVGKKMDLLLLDIPDYSYIAYHLGINPVHSVIKSGELVLSNRQYVYDK